MYKREFNDENSGLPFQRDVFSAVILLLNLTVLSLRLLLLKRIAFIHPLRSTSREFI